MALLSSVQSGTVSLGSAAITVSVTLGTSIVKNQSFLVFQQDQYDITSGKGNVMGEVVDNSTIRFSRASTGVAITIQWYVAYFSSGVTVQHGVVGPIGSTPQNITISAVTLARTFVIASSKDNDSGWFVNGGTYNTLLTSTTNLQINADSTFISETVSYQVIDFLGAAVQTGSIAFASGDASLSATISSAPSTSSFVILSQMIGFSSGNNLGQRIFKGVLSSSTQVTINRENTGRALTVYYQVVNFADGTIVRPGTTTFSGSDVSLANAISAVSLSKSVVFLHGLAQRSGTSNISTANDINYGSFQSALTSTTNLTLSRSTAGAAASAAWSVVQFNDTPLSLTPSNSTIIFSEAIGIEKGANFSLTASLSVTATVVLERGAFLAPSNLTVVLSESVGIEKGLSFGISQASITLGGSPSISVNPAIVFDMHDELIIATSDYRKGAIVSFVRGPKGYRLLDDSNSNRIFQATFNTADNGTGELTVNRFAQEGRITKSSDYVIEDPGPSIPGLPQEDSISLQIIGLYYKPRLIEPITRRASLWNGDVIGGFSEPGFGSLKIGNLKDIDGEDIEYLRGKKIEGERISIELTGELSDGTPIGAAEAIPVFNGYMDGAPEIGDEDGEINVIDDQWRFKDPISKKRFLDKCLYFPNTATDYVTFGDVLDRTTTFFQEAWVWIDDVTNPFSIIDKDDGTSGFGVHCNVTLPGSVEFVTRGLSNVTLTTPTSVLLSKKWHKIGWGFDNVSKTKLIYIDKTLISSVTGITGALSANAVALTVGGRGFSGSLSGWISNRVKIDDLRSFNAIRTLDQIIVFNFLQLLYNESNLDHYVKVSELDYQLNAILDYSQPSPDNLIIVPPNPPQYAGNPGTLVGGATFSDGDWPLSSIQGQAYPVCFGCSSEFEPICIDDVDQVYIWHDRASDSCPEVYDDNLPLTITTNYDLNLSYSLIHVKTALFGRLTVRPKGDSDGGYVEKTGDIMQRIAVQRTQSSFTASSVSLINSLWPGQAGIYIDGKQPDFTIQAALDSLCSAPLLAYFPRFNNDMVVVDFNEPGGQEDFSIDDRNIIGDFQPIKQEPPAWEVLIAYNHNFAYLSDTKDARHLLPDHPDRFDFAMNEWRWARAYDSAVLKNNPKARTITLYSQFTLESDAYQAALKWLNLMKYPREGYNVSVDLSAAMIDLNSVIKCTHYTLQMESGVKFRLISFDTKGSLEQIDLTIWGRKFIT